MTAPRLADLPPPPAGLVGWPWTVATPALAAAQTAASPLISIVTPSFNQGPFIERTIRSVLLQGYPRLEYIVIDGGSTDETVGILRKYERWISRWTSGPDAGQSDAINRGLEWSTGSVFNWLNSDDCLAPGALQVVAQLSQRDQPVLIMGRGQIVRAEDGEVLLDWHPRRFRAPLDTLIRNRVINPAAQPSVFLDLSTVRAVGGVRPDLHYVMDWELYFRLLVTLRDRLTVSATSDLLSVAYVHPQAKTSQAANAFHAEALRVLPEYATRLSRGERVRLGVYLRQARVDAAIIAALQQPGRAHWLRLLARYPDAITSRMFWGGVRRSVTPGWAS